MSEDRMLQEAIEAISKGQRIRARDLLTRLLRTDQNNPEYWLWMSSVVDTTKEQVFCLNTVLKLEPDNQQAIRGLIILGQRSPEGRTVSLPPVRRNWQVDIQKTEELHGIIAFWANPIFRFVLFVTLSIIVIGLMGLGISKLNDALRKPVAYIPTNTPGPSPTFTYTPTAINETQTLPTTTPAFEGPQPLWMRLDVTYTPTPFYVNTPHPASESFSIAQDAFQHADLESALEHYRQAAAMIPDAPDIPYLIGETFRIQGNFQKAIESYEQSLIIDPDFAPAYLSKAQVELTLDPEADISTDLTTSIKLDPNYAEAYLLRAGYLITQEKFESAQDDVDKAASLLPESPLPHLLQAQILLHADKKQTALDQARLAIKLDETLLQAYLVLAEAAAANGEFGEALQALEIYLDFNTQDPSALEIQAQAYLANGQYNQAMNAASAIIQFDKNNAEAYLYRGMAYIELEQGQKAVNDIFIAKNYQPQSFEVNLQFARALLTAGRFGDALSQINRTHSLAEQDNNDDQLAQALYWRAFIYEAIGNIPSALLDWKAILELPEGIVPENLKETAAFHLNVTVTSAATVTKIPTATQTSTTPNTPSPTFTEPAANTLTPTLSDTPKP